MSLLEVISYTGDNNTLVHKVNCEDLNTCSQLIVNESQEALLFKSGQALDLFPAGRHSLKTENLPVIKRIFSGIFGGGKPFPCEVIFINKVSILDIQWGTATPIQLEDPKYHLIINVRANGQTGIKIKDSRRFVLNVVGQLSDYTVDSVRKSIKGMMITSIKEAVAVAIVEKGISILEISTRLSELSDIIIQKLNDRIVDLGIEANHFSLDWVGAEDGDLEELKKARDAMVKGFAEADIEAYKLTKVSEARAKAREMEGYTYQEERRFAVLEGAAKNEGAAGGFINMGVGLGVGAGIAGDVRNMTAEMRNGGEQQQQVAATAVSERVCPSCGNKVPSNCKFCPMCGNALPELAPQASFCPQCGTKCAPGSKFCMNCGNKLC